MSDELDDRTFAVPRPGRKRWQVGLQTLVLLMAAIAVWMSYFVNRRHNAWLDARIKAMVPLAHELVIDDPAKVAAVKLEQHWYDENQWEVYLPDGRYRVCLATRAIDQAGLAPVARSAPIEAGRHVFALEQQSLGKDGWRVIISWDGAELFTVDEPKEWDPGLGASSSGPSSVSEQFATNAPVVFLRRQFMRPKGKGVASTPGEPAEGLLLWIERTADAIR